MPDRPSDQSPAPLLSTAPPPALPQPEHAAIPEEPTPMLDVHPAPHAASTWRDFFIHIATIVIGLLIAIGLEQAIEKLHQRHLRHQLQEALQRDGEDNREYIKDNIAVAQSIVDWALEQAVAVQHAGPTGPLTLRRMPAGRLYAPNAGVWLAAKASGRATLLSASEQNWLEDLNNLERETFESNASSKGQLNVAYAALDQAIIGYAKETPTGELDLSTLTPAQRSTVIACLLSITAQARSVMRGLVSYNINNEYILVTPPDRLDDPREGPRYAKITRENFAAHPALQYTFSAK